MIPAGIVGWLSYETERNLDVIIILTLLAFYLGILIVDLVIQNWPKSWEKSWYERDRLELYVLACLSSNRRPTLPILKEPELARHRYLKDAVSSGNLLVTTENGKANVFSTTTLDDFESFAEEKKHTDFIKIAKQWRALHPRNITLEAETGEYQVSGGKVDLTPSTDKHNIWLYDAIHYIPERDWDSRRLTIYEENESYISAIFQSQEEIHQSAFDGDLPIWGRTGFSGPLELIESDYWKKFGLNWFSLLKESPEEFQTEFMAIRNDGPIYSNLKTSKEIVEKLWKKES